MRKLLTMMGCLLGAVHCVGQTYLWKDGAVIFKMSAGTPDSITFVDPMAKSYFSVGEGKQVVFSPGNLQYQDLYGTWRFAEKQYEVIGNGNVNRTYDEGLVDSWIDLFGWGTAGWSEPGGSVMHEPTETSTDYKDYLLKGDWSVSISDESYWADWGCNEIEDYGEGWRTLTSAEWDYILSTRTGAADLFALATVAGQKGLILLPDEWELPSGMSFTPSASNRLKRTNGLYMDEGMTEDNFLDNVYDATEWSVMEGAGAIFLPAAGRRWGMEMKNFGWADWGVYWSSTTGAQEREGNVCALSFYISGVTPLAETSRAWGAAVRLVKDKETKE